MRTSVGIILSPWKLGNPARSESGSPGLRTGVHIKGCQGQPGDKATTSHMGVVRVVTWPGGQQSKVKMFWHSCNGQISRNWA